MKENGFFYRLGSAALAGAGIFAQLTQPVEAQFNEGEWQSGPAELEIAGKIVTLPRHHEYRSSPILCWSASENREAGCDMSAYEFRFFASRMAVSSVDGEILWVDIREPARLLDFAFLSDSLSENAAYLDSYSRMRESLPSYLR